MSLMLLGGVGGVLAGLGILEGVHHRMQLDRIPTRIHVNGTRGKSSVTRLIAAGMRAGGRRTSAKTTGTLARMIMPDGREYPVYRPARPNVIEQVRIVRAAASFESQALVIECMAVQPPLQALCEHRLVRSTHGVITNARADHLDVMGPEEVDVALALAATTPIRGILYTAEQRHLDVFEMAAKDRETKLVAIRPEDIAAITEDELSRFSYVEHAENIALALRVCEDQGIDRPTALAGMQGASADPGALTTYEIDFFGRHFVFVNSFAANDPESTGRIFHMMKNRYPDTERTIALVNCRADRPDRSAQLGAACTEWPKCDDYVLIGTGTYIFGKAAVGAGIDSSSIQYAEGHRVEDIFEIVADRAGKSALIVGVANIGGVGLDLVRYFRNRRRIS